MEGVRLLGLCLVVGLFGLVVAELRGRRVKEQCAVKHSYTGCRLMSGQCECSTELGCENSFPYRNKHQCWKDVHGKFNKCIKSPCVHGQCLQVKVAKTRRFLCMCAGSGYYGNICQKKCPQFDRSPLPKNFPTDCIF